MADNPTGLEDMEPGEEDTPWPSTRTERMEDGENVTGPSKAGFPDPRKEFLRAVANKVLDKPDMGREDTYATIARFWTTYIQGRFEGFVDGDLRIEDYDVALMMDLFKTARLTHDPHHEDSWVDKAGYTVGGHEKAVTDRPRPQE